MHDQLLRACGLDPHELTGRDDATTLTVTTPIDGSVIARLPTHSPADTELAIARAAANASARPRQGEPSSKRAG